MLSEEFQSKLLERFPWAEARDHDGNGKGYLVPCWCGDGWFQIIWNMLEELEQFCKTRVFPLNLQLLEIKEKYGGMRVDFGCGDTSSAILDRVYEIIEKYENLAEDTCESCGDKGKVYEVNGWLSAYCQNCYETAIKKFN